MKSLVRKFKQSLEINPFKTFKILFLSGLFLTTCTAVIKIIAEDKRSSFIDSTAQALPSDEAYFVSSVSSGVRKYNHSPSILSLDDKKIAVWYAGDREGGTNMEIMLSTFESGKWSKERTLVTRDDVKGVVRRIGNPIVFSHPKSDDIHIIFTSTVSGWATSQLNVMKSQDGGNTWSKPQRLYLGSILNFSYLTRCKPLYYENGEMLLPLYHEFIAKYSVLARAKPDGHGGFYIKDHSKLSSFRDSLQPCVNIANKDGNGVAFMRNANDEKYGEKLLINKFDKNFNGSVQTLEIYNNNGSVASVNYKDYIILFHNNKGSSKDMTMTILDKSLNIITQHLIDRKHSKYPYIVKTNKSLNMVYSSSDGKYIKYINFPNSFIDKIIQSGKNYNAISLHRR